METNYLFAPDIYSDNCPSRRVLDRLADKWTVLIVAKLADGTQRFGELRRSIEGISPKMLTQSLRSADGPTGCRQGGRQQKNPLSRV